MIFSVNNLCYFRVLICVDFVICMSGSGNGRGREQDVCCNGVSPSRAVPPPCGNYYTIRQQGKTGGTGTDKRKIGKKDTCQVYPARA